MNIVSINQPLSVVAAPKLPPEVQLRWEEWEPEFDDTRLPVPEVIDRINHSTSGRSSFYQSDTHPSHTLYGTYGLTDT